MWPFKKSAPLTVDEQTVMSPNSRFNANWKFTYEAKRLPSPGTQNYAYENLGLVEYTPIGAAESNRAFLRPMQPAPQYALFATYLQGLGGLAQGTVYGTPLLAPQTATPVEDQIHG